MSGDLVPIRRYSEEGSAQRLSRKVSVPTPLGLNIYDSEDSEDESEVVHSQEVKPEEKDSKARMKKGYHVSELKSKIVASRIKNLGKRLLKDFKNPVKVAQWRICVALGFGKRQRVPGSVENRVSVTLVLKKGFS